MRPAPRWIPIAAVLLASCLAPPIARAETHWLDPGSTFPTPVADPREPRMGFDYEEGGAWSLRAGGRVTIAHVVPADTRIGIDGMAWLWFATASRLDFPLETVDGFAGVWVERRSGRWAARARLSHHSGHLADGSSAVGRSRRAYSRERLGLLGAFTPRPGLELYAGPALWVRASPAAPACQFQLGAVIEARADAPRRARPFAACDFRIAAGNAGRVTQGYRAGLRLPGGPGNGVRLAIGYDDGISERGQLFDTAERRFSIGAAFGD
jgi:hypothetical protein